MTKVVNLAKTDCMSSNDVFIGRPSKWGNPFVIGKDGTRDEVIKKYRSWIKTRHDLTLAIHELVDKNLVCYCKPQACHGDVLVEMANEWKMWKGLAIEMACEEMNVISWMPHQNEEWHYPTEDERLEAEKTWKIVADKHGLDVEEFKAAYQDW